MAERESYLIPLDRVERAILEIRGEKVMLDRDLAGLYGVTTRRLKEQVRRNLERFPGGFMFQLTWDEVEGLIHETEPAGNRPFSRSQNATLKRSRNVKYPPFAFTEHGAVMLRNAPDLLCASLWPPCFVSVHLRNLRHLRLRMKNKMSDIVRSG